MEEFNVEHVNYTKHEKAGKPPMVKVSYYCGYRAFHEYVCFEHQDFAGRKARQWWKRRTQEDFPASTEEALDRIDKIKTATSLRVWTNKQYPEIMDVCLDGSKFGKQEPCPVDSPVVNIIGRVKATTEEFDEDIPF